MPPVPEFTWNDLPPLQTVHLHLRALVREDRADLLAVYGDAEVMRYASDPPYPDLASMDGLLASVTALFQQKQSLEWGVCLSDNRRVIGTCGLHSFSSDRTAAEIGCLLNRSYWGQSLMREALDAVILFARDTLSLTTLLADIDAPNARSRALFARLGFAPLHPAGTIYTRTLSDA